MATLAKSIVALRDQVNRAHPNRSKASDGTWPSAAHRRQSPNSDHNHGNAIDFTHDPRNGFNSEKFAEHLRQSRDPRLKYVISNRKIASAKSNWQWRRYSGNAHDRHVHISVNRHNDSAAPWRMPGPVIPRAGIASLDVDESPPDPAILQPQEGDDGITETEMEGQGADERTAAEDEVEGPEGAA